MIEIRKIEEIRRGVDIPEITAIYDPLSGKRDGTITPMAPVVVSGSNFSHYQEDCRLCLVAEKKPVEVIEIKLVYTYSDKKVIVAIPELKPGEYRPAVRLKEGKGEVYVLPALWMVRGRWWKPESEEHSPRCYLRVARRECPDLLLVQRGSQWWVEGIYPMNEIAQLNSPTEEKWQNCIFATGQ